MKLPDDVWTTTAITQSGLKPGMAGATAVEMRAEIIKMTQTAEDAVLKPQEPGAWSLPLRALFAARIARLNGADGLAAHYTRSIDVSDYATVADPDAKIRHKDLEPGLAFLDAVATSPRDVTAGDIKTLQSAGVSDADIVRLAELVAFVSYQIRLVAGLALLAESAR